MSRAAPVLVLCLALAACAKKAAKDEEIVRPVRVAPVGSGDFVERVAIVGELEGKEEMRIVSQLPERIRTLAVSEGSRVKAGDILVVLAMDALDQGVNQALAGLEAAKAGRDGVQESLARARLLREAGSLPPAQLETIEAQARAAEAQVRLAATAVDQAATQRGRSVVRAPITGVVSQLILRPGDLAAPGVPIMTIVQDDVLKAVLRVPERDFLRVAVGQPITLSPLARPEQRVPAKISKRSPVVDRLTRTGVIEVELDNRDGALVAGTAVRGEIEVARRPGVVLAPASAIVFTAETGQSGEALAFLAIDGKAVRRTVSIGGRSGGELEIRAGLEVGEPLIVLGATFLRDGNPVAVQGDAAARPAAAAAATQPATQPATKAVP